MITTDQWLAQAILGLMGAIIMGMSFASEDTYRWRMTPANKYGGREWSKLPLRPSTVWVRVAAAAMISPIVCTLFIVSVFG